MSSTPVSRRFLPIGIRLAVLGLVLSTLLISGPAFSQVCGDASGDGNVTVTDGVQTLRAAAQLSSSCSVATCDVDGSGSITVTDGVNVLRKAAGLTAPSACGGGGGGDQAEVQTLTTDAAPLLIFAFTAVAEVESPLAPSVASAVKPAGSIVPIDEDECPAGGTRRKTLLGGCIINVTFQACGYSAPTLGSFQFDRGVALNFCRSNASILLDVKDLDSGRAVHFEGFVDFQQTGDGIVANGGPVVLTTPQGKFSLTFNQLSFDRDGHPSGGSGEITDDDDVFELARMTFTVTGPTTASVVGTFDDGHTANFVLNTITGDFTPA